jgi:hypothetical protein
VEYPRSSLTVAAAPNLTTDDLELPTGIAWPSLPHFGPAMVIGTRVTPAGCDSLRLKEVLGVREKGRLRGSVACLHGSDRQLIRLGLREGSIGSDLSLAKAAAVVGPGFSTWWNWSPFESLVAMARSAWFASELARHCPTVPTVVWRTETDLIRWATWIVSERIPAIALHVGSIRGAEQWRWAMVGIARLSYELDQCDTVPHLIINGPSTIDRMTTVRAAWRGGLTFASQNPWLLAQGGKRLLDNLLAVEDGAPRRVLERANRHTFNLIASQVVRGGGQTRMASEPELIPDTPRLLRPSYG